MAQNTQRGSVRLKLLTAFCVIIAFTVAIAGLSLTQMISTNNIIKDVENLLTVRHGRTSRVQDAAVAADDFTYNLSIDPSSFDEPKQKELENLVTEVTASIDGLKAGKNAAIVAAIKDAGPKYAEITRGEFTQALKSGDLEQCSAAYDKLSDQYDIISKNIGKLVQFQIRTAAASAGQAASNVLIIVIAVLAGAAVIIALLIAFVYSGRIVSSLTSAVKSAQIIGNGDLSVPVKVTSNDEFGTLQHSLEKMRASWNELVGLIKNTVGSVEGNVGRIQDVTARINESAKNTQNRSLTVAAASDEMVSTTGDIAKNCESAAQSAAKTNQTTQDGVASIQETIGIIKDQASKSEDDAKKVSALAEQANKVSSIVETIEDIANQTNLLALNAAIEAARAGEAGKGFAVVADEVRSLASRTSKSTQEITRMVTSMQNDAQSANESMAQSLDNMHSIADRTNGIQDVLNAVADQVSGVSGQITQIATAAEEQTTATSEISTNMKEITDAAKGFSSEVDEANTEVTSTVDTLNELLSHVDRIKV